MKQKHPNSFNILVGIALGIAFMLILNGITRSTDSGFKGNMEVVQEDYLRMAIKSFSEDGNEEIARWRYSLLGKDGRTILKLMEKDERTDPLSLISFTDKVESDNQFLSQNDDLQHDSAVSVSENTTSKKPVGLIILLVLVVLLLVALGGYYLYSKNNPDRAYSRVSKKVQEARMRRESVSNESDVGTVNETDSVVVRKHPVQDEDFKKDEFQSESIEDEKDAPFSANLTDKETEPDWKDADVIYHDEEENENSAKAESESVKAPKKIDLQNYSKTVIPEKEVTISENIPAVLENSEVENNSDEEESQSENEDASVSDSLGEDSPESVAENQNDEQNESENSEKEQTESGNIKDADETETEKPVQSVNENSEEINPETGESAAVDSNIEKVSVNPAVITIPPQDILETKSDSDSHIVVDSDQPDLPSEENPVAVENNVVEGQINEPKLTEDVSDEADDLTEMIQKSKREVFSGEIEPAANEDVDNELNNQIIPKNIKDENAPLIHYSAEFKLGDDLFDETLSMEDSHQFLGECGIGIAETMNNTDPKAVTAFEIWLFDRADVQTPTPTYFLLSNYAYNNAAIFERLKAKGSTALIDTGKKYEIKSMTMRMEVKIISLVYGSKLSQSQSYFEKVMFDICVWKL